MSNYNTPTFNNNNGISVNASNNGNTGNVKFSNDVMMFLERLDKEFIR